MTTNAKARFKIRKIVRDAWFKNFGACHSQAIFEQITGQGKINSLSHFQIMEGLSTSGIVC